MGIEPTTEGRKRRNDRLRAEVAAHFVTLEGKQLLSICDLSQTGARLRPHASMKPGTQGVLMWLRFEAFGQVVRSDGDYVGIEFDEEIKPVVLFETRRLLEAGVALSEAQLKAKIAGEWVDGLR
jgi:hypothetical protein